MTEKTTLSRREMIARGGTAFAALAFFNSPLFAQIWGREGERVVPFLDQPPAPPPELEGVNLLDWQRLDSLITPNEQFFRIGHYGVPSVQAASWRLEVGGLVEKPASYSLADLKALPQREVVFTLECSGNSGFDWFQGGIGTARWGGASLATVLERAGVKQEAIEVVFYGADEGEETVPYIGGLGDRVGEFTMKTKFARSMSLEEAMAPENLLCYEMNGEPLPAANGFPLRLIAPGWYGIANVKWLERIEIHDRRFLGPFMARRYVTVRELPQEGGGTAWTRSSVGKYRIKSVPAKVTVSDGAYRIYGAAWGAPIRNVEVRVDGGAWRRATIDEGQNEEFAWKLWHLDWSASPGEHAITSRAIDTAGNVQPAPDDPFIAGKRTYWEANEQITRRIRIS